jgi:hypothetical protein
VAAPFVVGIVRILADRPRPVLYGDQALIALGVHRAIRFEQLLGPYSRDGFHHPGPAMFYLLAPFAWLFHPIGAGMYLGATTINGAALVAAVAVLWRRAGSPAALWAGGVIGAYSLFVGTGTFREPWNPYMVVAPAVLFTVLWAAALTGSPASMVWALVTGSYMVQTDIATAPFVAAMSAVLLAAAARRAAQSRRGPGGRPNPGGTSLAGLAVLLLMWLPAVVELWRDHPDNVQVLWTYVTSRHPGAPLHAALSTSLDAMTIVPFGNHDYVLALHRSGPVLATGVLLVLSGALIAGWLGMRRRKALASAICAAGMSGAVVGGGSMLLAGNPLFPYFAVWLAFVPLAFLLAAGVAVLAIGGTPGGVADRSPPRSLHLAPVIVVAVVVLVAGIWSAEAALPAGRTTGSGPWPSALAPSLAGREQTLRDTVSLTDAIAGALPPGDRRIQLDMEDASLWPLAAGAVLALEERGVQTVVAPASWNLYFGKNESSGHAATSNFQLQAPAASSQHRGILIARNQDLVLTYIGPPRN